MASLSQTRVFTESESISTEQRKRSNKRSLSRTPKVSKRVTMKEVWDETAQTEELRGIYEMEDLENDINDFRGF